MPRMTHRYVTQRNKETTYRYRIHPCEIRDSRGTSQNQHSANDDVRRKADGLSDGGVHREVTEDEPKEQEN